MMKRCRKLDETLQARVALYDPAWLQRLVRFEETALIPAFSKRDDVVRNSFAANYH